jgi:tetraacyldisaccharide-1-P 4'-kinase
MLTEHGLGLRSVALADHEVITAAHLESCDEPVILVTAKDAVKLPRDTDPRVWVVEIEVALPASLLARLEGLLPAPTQASC